MNKTNIIDSIQSYVENNFSIVLILFTILGFILPGIQNIPDQTVLWLLGAIIFLSCTNIKTADLKHINIKETALFYLARFIVVPVCLYLIASQTLPDLKEGILLLALMPVGTAAPAFTKILNGNITLSLGSVVISGLLAPFVIPAIVSALGYAALNIDPINMLLTLSCVIFIPILTWFGLAHHAQPLKNAAQSHGKFISIIFVGLIITLVIAKKRALMLNDPSFVILALVLLLALFALFFAIAWLWPHQKNHEIRLTQTVNSCIMNNALGMSLALIYFSEKTALFLVLSEIPWVLFMPAFQLFLNKRKAIQ